MRVVIVEDERLSRAVIIKAVEQLGHEVRAFEDGFAALAGIEQVPTDVVLTDWVMPRLDGPGLCRAIRAKPRERYVYIVLITSLGRSRNLALGLDAGADDFINKPIDIEELGARLRVAERIIGLQTRMKQMRGMLSICTFCDKVRDGEQWVSIERYVEGKSETSFSHGLCPTCNRDKFGPGSEFDRTGRWPQKD